MVWGIAALGVTAKLLNRLRHPLWSTALYVVMGWVAVIAAGPLIERMPMAGLAWLVAGGLAYTAGAVVFLFDNKVRYAHFVWHLFVLAGSVCHFFAGARLRPLSRRVIDGHALPDLARRHRLARDQGAAGGRRL